ncbi:hypothetical protein DPMN_042916 [Dreissena polymorpha]|uniref:Uncharacterized protein n=1 Tax=Dreissena polymorpha TaxID=45954 RepID=A0A9D4D2X6_DREPO|nr:hypothetical protein DPMN_042916 [Dreissena polymorpha]
MLMKTKESPHVIETHDETIPKLPMVSRDLQQNSRELSISNRIWQGTTGSCQQTKESCQESSNRCNAIQHSNESTRQNKSVHVQD